jgi:hypothetical protein
MGVAVCCAVFYVQGCDDVLLVAAGWCCRGTLRNTGNMMFMAALMGKYGNNKQAHICWARSQMRYITGTATGKSYLVRLLLLLLLQPSLDSLGSYHCSFFPARPFTAGVLEVDRSHN